MKTAILAAALLATGAAAQPADPQVRPQSQLDRALAGRVAGAPVPCVNLRLVTRTEIIGDVGILYRVGGRVYLNRPSVGTEWLDRDSILVSRQPIGQQCRGDQVQVVERTARIDRGFVVLGDFVPYTRVAPRA